MISRVSSSTVIFFNQWQLFLGLVHPQLLFFRFGTLIFINWLLHFFAFCSQCQHFNWLFVIWDQIWSSTLTTIFFHAVNLLYHLFFLPWDLDRFLMIETVFDAWLFKCWSPWSCIVLVRWSRVTWRMCPCIIHVPWWICIYMSIGRHPRHWHWRPKTRIWICCIKIITLPIPILLFAPWGWSWFLCMVWPISILLFTLLLIFIQ